MISSSIMDRLDSDSNPLSTVVQIPKKRGPKPGSPGQLRSLANLKPWKKGERANPNGRPKKTLTEALIAKLGRKRAFEVATALIDTAAKGDVSAFKELADRLEGKVPQQIEVSGNVDLGVRIASARDRRRQISVIDAEVTVTEPGVQNLVNSLPTRTHQDNDEGTLDMTDIFGR
jgi:hypothetical protein